MELTLENLISLMKDVNDEADYENCTTLVDDRVLTSFDILAIIGAIDDEFDIAIPAGRKFGSNAAGSLFSSKTSPGRKYLPASPIPLKSGSPER